MVCSLAVVRELNLIRLFCCSHCRRRFVDVLKSLGLNPKKLPSKPPLKAQRALVAIGYIKTLCAIERRIKDFRRHDLRHTWASWHVQNGTPIHVLQELGGWSNIRMVQRFAHLAPEHLARYADNVDDLKGVNGTFLTAHGKISD